MHLHAEALSRRRQAAELGPAVRVGGEPETAGHFPAGGEARFLFQPLVELDGIFEHARDGGR